MNDFAKNMAQALFNQDKINDLLRQEIEIEIQVPRDRNGKFYQHTLPDYKQHSDVLEDMVIKHF